MRLSIVVIGDEILLGQVTDTNSGEISRILGADGWQTVSVRVIGDNASDIRAAISDSLSKSDLVITTGGLGPTKDDITKHVLADMFDGSLVMDASVSRNIDEVFARRGLKVNEYTRNQALVPDSCRVIQNVLGTAPIMWFESFGRVLIAMPGVPFETVGMMHRSVRDAIRQRFSPDKAMRHHTLIVSGISESALAMRLSEWEDTLPESLHLAYLPVPGYIRLRLDGMADDPVALDAAYDSALGRLRQLVGDLLIHDGDATPAEIVLERLRRHSLTVSTAESCTGGNIAHSITSVAGCSDMYYGSVVSYANSVKTDVLGVPADDISAFGAVSQEVVEAMARGVCQRLGTDCSVATSGVAGPGGGSADKPVGTVWIAACVKGNVVSHCFHFPGDRARVIDRATTEALLMLARQLA